MLFNFTYSRFKSCLFTMALGLFAFSAIIPFQVMGQIQLEKIISREDPRFDCENATMSLGRDGNVYLSTNAKPGYVLRVSPDGKKQQGAEVLYALLNATANSAGIIATANVHFIHAVNIYEKDFKPRGLLKEFLVNDKVGWDAPARIETGASDDFYAIDQHRNRVLRINTSGKIMRVLNIPVGVNPVSFRVSEAAQALYLLMKNGTLQSVGFDGQIRWTLKITPIFTIQDDGTVLYLAKNKLKRINSEGHELSDIDLAIEDISKFPVTGIAASKDDLVLKRRHPTELFQIYNVKSGKLKTSVLSAHENISATFPNLIWIAGEKIPLSIKSNQPLRWHVWASAFGTSDWRELEFKDALLNIPKDFAGLYQIRIGPIINPEAQSEYLLREIVEVRIPQSMGSLSVWTPLNRVHWARGEPIPISMELRNGKVESEINAKLSLVSVDADSKNVSLWSEPIKFVGSKKIISTIIPAEVTKKLSPGRYLVRAESHHLTCVDQPLKLGMPLDSVSPFLITEYGDYLNFNSVANAWEFSDVAEEMLDRSKRLNINQYVNRIFASRFPLTFSNLPDGKVVLETLQKRLESSPEGVSPQKAEFGFAHAHALGAFGAEDIREMLLLVGMDAALPIGTSTYYSKGIKFEEYSELIKKYSDALKSFPAFHGWDWVANWWVTDANLKFKNQEEKKAYEEALKEADDNGLWNPVLDKVGDNVVGWQVDAQSEFKKALAKIDSKFSTASSGPYRRPGVYPPMSFRNVDEVDLHYQAEQITTPNWTAHAVDYYKRPGKTAWLHPELWNDTGTGEQILPMSFLAIMRGVDGIGLSGKIQGDSGVPIDSRSASLGTASVFRALNTLASAYGPWLKNLKNSDQIAILVSSRQVKLAQFSNGNNGGIYFVRLYEAYQSCLYAHMPATFIFTEDKPDLSRFKALLIVGQRYDPEPALVKLLSEAQKSGLLIFADGSSRESIVQNFRPLDISFNNIEKLNGFNNDMAYWDFPQVFLKLAPKIAEKLASIMTPIAIVDQPEVLLSEVHNGDTHFVWVVNNTRSPLPPALLWRVQPGISTTYPVVAHVKINVKPNEVVYDLFAKKEISSEFNADLRYLPARLYAILPKKLDPLKLDAPRFLNPVENFFGPHVKDIVISKDETTALLNTFDWDQNLFGIDLATGKVLWTNKIGDYFAYAPVVWGNGFASQGFDLNSASGYHLYSIDLKGSIKQRFAIPGIPARLTNWAAMGPILNDSINNFAVSPDGSWIAAGGNQATAVWDKKGKLWWKEDWSQLSRKTQIFLPLDNQTLLSAEGISLSAKNAKNAKVKWVLPLAESGEIQSLAMSADTRTVLATSTQNKKVFILRDGKLKATLPLVASSLVVAINGAWVAATNGKQVLVYSDKAQPLWIFAADSSLGKLCGSADGKLLAVSSELGTLYVFDVASGKVILRRDMGALSTIAWLHNGDLLSATWMGIVSRFTKNGSEKWRVQLADVKSDLAIKPQINENKIPTVQLTRWPNAVSKTSSLRKNLLNSKNTRISATSGTTELKLQNTGAMLFDGIALPLERPWITWEDIDMIDSGWRGSFSFVIDTMKTKLRVDEISFVEDANHPESWLRDAKLEYWNPIEERWMFGQYLVSDSVVHSHKLTKPIEASKFRITRPDSAGWPVGNLRFEKIAFYGETL